MVGEQALAGEQVRVAVAVEIAHGHGGVELAEVGFHLDLLEGPLAVTVLPLPQPGQAIGVGGRRR